MNEGSTVKSKKLDVFPFEKIDAPAAFREAAEKGLAQAKESYDRFKAAADEATAQIETTCATVSKGATDYGLKLIEVARANANATFDFTSQLIGTRSLSEMVELSTSHARQQFDTLQTQVKELAALAQKVVTDSAEPIKEGVSKLVKKVA